MKKKTEVIDEQVHCTKCGGKMLKSEVPAEDYEGFSLSIYTSKQPEKYNKKGERQFLTRYQCENYGETKGCFFKTKVEHDLFARKIPDFEYEYKYVSRF